MAYRHPSDLSDPHYGYDVVVATTQKSINKTMKIYLDSLPNPVVTICYVASEDDPPVPKQVDYEQLKKKMHGVDPFQVPAGVKTNDHAISEMTTNRFMAGIRYRIGIPDMTDLSQVPDAVVLNSSASAVTLHLLCDQFTVCQFTPPGGWTTKPNWFNQQQLKDQPWIFGASVDIRQSSMPTDGTAFSQLPADVQKKIHNTGDGMFSVQQLLFDLTTAKLMSAPTFTGVPPNSQLWTILQEYFIQTYIGSLAAAGQPLLGVTAVSKQSPTAAKPFDVKDFDFEVSPYVDVKAGYVPDMTTLNYLCATRTSKVASPVKFPWNWVEQGEQHDGVAVINRDTLLDIIEQKLSAQFDNGCIGPETHCSADWKGSVTYSATYHGGNKAPIVRPPTGPVVLTIDWHGFDHNAAGVNGDLGELKLGCDYVVRVMFNGETTLSDGKTVIPSQIVVAQDCGFSVSVRADQSTAWGDPWHKIFTDTFTIGVDGDGVLKFDVTPNVEDKSFFNHAPGAQDFFTRVNGLADGYAQWSQNFAEADFKSISLSDMQGLVFPGGRDFIFSHALFSDNQDLVGYINYADPNQGPIVLPPETILVTGTNFHPVHPLEDTPKDVNETVHRVNGVLRNGEETQTRSVQVSNVAESSRIG